MDLIDGSVYSSGYTASLEIDSLCLSNRSQRHGLLPVRYVDLCIGQDPRLGPRRRRDDFCCCRTHERGLLLVLAKTVLNLGTRK